MRVRAARADEGPRLRELRLASLAADPAAFTSTHGDEAARPAEWWTRWAALSEAGVEQRTFAACARWAAEQGFSAVNLGVIRSNAAALRLYEAAGFSVVDETGRILTLTHPLS